MRNRRGHDIIVVGASAGGVEALRALVGGLPADLPAAIFVVLHIPPHGSSLPTILDKAGPLEARQATDSEPILRGRVYVARPDHHLLVDRERVRVKAGPKENRHRPSVDVLLRSAAQAHGPRVIAVILSGTRDDGATGLVTVRQRGGLAVVQDPADAMFPDMPRAALEAAGADHCVALAEMPTLLSELCHQPAPPEAAFPLTAKVEIENRIAHMEKSDVELVGQLGRPSVFSCPECHGVLWEMDDPRLLRFRCQVGHAFSGAALADYQLEVLEDALWAAVRSLNENARLARRLEERARQSGHQAIADDYRERAEEAESHSKRLRAHLEARRELAGEPALAEPPRDR